MDDAPLDFSMKPKSIGSAKGSCDELPKDANGNNIVPDDCPMNLIKREAASSKKCRSNSGADSPPASPAVDAKSLQTLLSNVNSSLIGGLPASLLPAVAANLSTLQAGLSQMSPALILKGLANDAAPADTRKQAPPNHAAAGNKSLRPFKAYPKDPLSLPLGYYGLPGMSPFPPIDVAVSGTQSMTPEEMYTAYKEHVLKMHHAQQPGSTNGGSTSPQSSSSPSMSPAPSITIVEPKSPADARLAASMAADLKTSLSNVLLQPPPALDGLKKTPSVRKRGRALPDDQKDESYWERRRKNNEAAKRSRDTRRAKEDEIAIRAAFLEQENLKLRMEVHNLRAEAAKLRSMLYTNSAGGSANGDDEP